MGNYTSTKVYDHFQNLITIDLQILKNIGNLPFGNYYFKIEEYEFIIKKLSFYKYQCFLKLGDRYVCSSSNLILHFSPKFLFIINNSEVFLSIYKTQIIFNGVSYCIKPLSIEHYLNNFTIYNWVNKNMKCLRYSILKDRVILYMSPDQLIYMKKYIIYDDYGNSFDLNFEANSFSSLCVKKIVNAKDGKFEVSVGWLESLKSDFINSQLENLDEEIYIPLFKKNEISVKNLDFLDYIQSGVYDICKFRKLIEDNYHDKLLRIKDQFLC